MPVGHLFPLMLNAGPHMSRKVILSWKCPPTARVWARVLSVLARQSMHRAIVPLKISLEMKLDDAEFAAESLDVLEIDMLPVAC